jgi:hypothetical protein
VRSKLIVLFSPVLDLGPGIAQRLEPVDVQTLVPEAAAKGLDKGIVRRLSRSGEIQRHSVIVGPRFKGLRDELGAIISPDRLRQATGKTDSLQQPNHMPPSDALIGFDRKALATKVIHYGKRPESTTVMERV